MSQTAWIVALSAVALVSAILSFVAWSHLARSPGALPTAPEPEDGDAEEETENGEAGDAGDQGAEHE